MAAEKIGTEFHLLYSAHHQTPLLAPRKNSISSESPPEPEQRNAPMPNVLITGAASGLGKAFVTAYLRIPHTSVLAVDKTFSSSTNPAQQDNLEAAAAYRLDVGNDETSMLRLFTVDVRDETQITTQLRDVGDIDVVVHSAGVRGLESSVLVQKGEDVAKAEGLDVISKETMMDTFCINTVGTFVLIRALLPKLRAGGGNSRSKVVVMGSRMGSMGSNTTGGGYAYRASKAAVNAVVKSFSIDVPEVVFAIVHPGRVESGLVAVKEDGAISAEESVRDVLGLIGRLGKEDSGRFFDRFGREVPW